MDELNWNHVRDRLSGLLPEIMLDALECGQCAEVFTDASGAAYAADAAGRRTLGVRVRAEAVEAAIDELEACAVEVIRAGELGMLSEARGPGIRMVGIRPPFARRPLISLRRIPGEAMSTSRVLMEVSRCAA